MREVIIRDATEADADQITQIYNDILTTSTAIYSDIAETSVERLAWLHARWDEGFPVLVASEAKRVLGFASYGHFRSWPGYRYTVEGTIHLQPDARGEGLGSRLLETLIEHAQKSGKHVMIAGVDSENIASLRFLTKSGFEQVGTLHEVGFKDGQFLDLLLLQYQLRTLSRKDNADRGWRNV